MQRLLNSEIAVACMNESELSALNLMLENHNIYWTHNPAYSCDFPITVYYDEGGYPTRQNNTHKFLNYMSGDAYLQDWGVPIITFEDFLAEDESPIISEEFTAMI